MNRPMRPAVLVASVCLALGCSSQPDTVAHGDGSLDGTHTADGAVSEASLDGSDVGPGADGNTGDGSAGDGAVTRMQFCSGSGSTGATDVTGTGTCGGGLAAVTFRYALCTCEGLVTSGALTTDSFDSSLGGYAPGGHGGSVGSNARLSATGALAIGGSLLVGGTDGMIASSTLDVTGELRCGGAFTSDGPSATVSTNAWIGGNVQARTLTIEPTLTLPAAATINVSGTSTIGATVRAPVTVPPPCDCDPSLLLDVNGIVAAHQHANDNADVALDPASFDNLTAPTTLTLACGRFYLDRIAGSGALTLNLSGRTALYIGGDISVSSLSVQLAAGAELDLFVAGDIVASSTFSLGSMDTPALTRLYLGGTGTIDLTHTALFAGNLYAPQAELVLAANTVIYGGVFVRRVSTAGDLTIHYDTHVLSEGSECPPMSAPTDGGTPDASTGCTSCRQCDNQACIGGTCGACTDDSQCCAPLACVHGLCIPIPG